MKTAMITALLMTAACATDPSTSTSRDGLCIEGDTDCGAPGSNPSSLSEGWVTTNYATATDISASCFATYNSDGSLQSYQCSVSFSWGGVTYSAGCAVYGDGSLDCGIDG